jgi:hypothetical protein
MFSLCVALLTLDIFTKLIMTLPSMTHTMSKNEVLGLMLSCKYGLSHQPVVAGLYSCYDCLGLAALPCISCAFLCCHEAASKCKVLSQTQANSYRKTNRMFETSKQIELYIIDMSLMV